MAAASAGGRPSRPPSAVRHIVRRASPTRTRPRSARSAAVWLPRSRTATGTPGTSAAPAVRSWPCRSPARPSATSLTGRAGCPRHRRNCGASWYRTSSRSGVTRYTATWPPSRSPAPRTCSAAATTPPFPTDRRCLWPSGWGSGCCWRRSATAISCASARTARHCWRCPATRCSTAGTPRACARSGAGDSFRVAAVDLTGTAVLAALLATDGYGNAQVAQVWESVVSAELAGLITTRPVSLDRQPVAGAGGPVRLGGRQRRRHHSRAAARSRRRAGGPAAPVPPVGG